MVLYRRCEFQNLEVHFPELFSLAEKLLQLISTNLKLIIIRITAVQFLNPPRISLKFSMSDIPFDVFIFLRNLKIVDKTDTVPMR